MISNVNLARFRLFSVLMLVMLPFARPLINSPRNTHLIRLPLIWSRALAADNWNKPELEHQADGEELASNLRRRLIENELTLLRIDAQGLANAAISSIQNPTVGYDGRFGKSAIKTYRAFLYPKSPTVINDTFLGDLLDNSSWWNEQQQKEDPVKLKAEAARCARHIEFLLKRHAAHQQEWIRHHDSETTSINPKQVKTFPLILLLDNVRSAFNVGSIFRTAEAAGCSMVITTGITPHPHGSGAEKLFKSALGAEQIVPSRHFTTTLEALDYICQELSQYEVIGLETTSNSVAYTSYPFSMSRGAVLVLGNEVTGVDPQILPVLDAIIEIPMFGRKNSLNVAACAPVVVYEIIRQWTSEIPQKRV